MRIVRVRRWLTAEKKIVYVFLGTSSSPPHLALLRRIEKGETTPAEVVRIHGKELHKHYGPEFRTLLALDAESSHSSGNAATTVKYVTDAIFSDDTIKSIKHKLSTMLTRQEPMTTTGDGDHHAAYNNLYMWRERRVRPSSSATGAFVKEAFRNRLTVHVRDLARDLARFRFGYYDEKLHALRADVKILSAPHAEKTIDAQGGIERETVPVGHKPVTTGTGHVAFFDHHPFKVHDFVSSSNDVVSDSAKNAYRTMYEDDALLEDFGGTSNTCLTLDLTTLSDLERHFRRSAARHERNRNQNQKQPQDATAVRALLEVYFPRGFKRDTSRDPSNAAVQSAALEEHSALMRWGHEDSPQYTDTDDIDIVLIHLRNQNSVISSVMSSEHYASSAAFAHAAASTSSSSSSSTLETINLEAVFNLFTTSSRVPLVKFYDGNTSVYKINRMALHKRNVDVTWVANWFSKRGKSRSAQPFVQFVTLVEAEQEGEKELFVRSVMTTSGKLDLMCVFSVNDPGHASDVKRCMRAVNKNVVRSLNKADKDSIVFFHDFDEHVMREGQHQNESMTTIVNIVTNTVIDASDTESSSQSQQEAKIRTGGGKQRHAGFKPPSLERIAAVMNDLFPYFELIVRQAPVMGDGLSAFYKRTSVTGSDMSWVVATKTLFTVFGFDKELTVRHLARSFMVTEAAASQRVTDIQQGRYADLQRVLLLQHYVPHVPTVTVKPHGRSAFRVATVLMKDAVLVRRVIALMRRVISVASISRNEGNTKHTFRLRAVEDVRQASVNETIHRRNSQTVTEEGEAGVIDDDFLDESSDPISSNLIDDHIEDVLSEEIVMPDDAAGSSTTRGSVTNADGVDENDSDDTDNRAESSTGRVLEELKRADPDVFDNRAPTGSKHRYATRCGAASKRQPVVVTDEELKRMDPESYGKLAIAYGSTKALADRNRYICPKVWCPDSRVGMTAEQYKARGSKCPLAGEEAIVFDNEYWKGKPRYPGLIGSTKHPTGLCMPCCYLHHKPNMHKCDSANASTNADPDGEDENAMDFRYIMGDRLPLETNRFGMVPSALLSAFHGDEVRNKKFRCGSRDDGSGQFTFNTDCFVRRGVPLSRQSFLRCMAEVLEVEGGVDALVNTIIERLSPDVFVAMSDGLVCRMFMDQILTAMQESPTGDATESDVNRYDSFVKWFLRDDAYREKMGLDHLAQLLRSKAADNHRHHPEVRREYLVYKSLQRFKAYLQDDGIIKVHKLLLGLFNMKLPWLNTRGINVVVFEQSPDDENGAGHAANSDMRVDCEGLRQDTDRIRLSAPFVFITKQKGIYEPIHRVRFRKPRSVIDRDVDVLAEKAETAPRTSSASSSGRISSRSGKKRKIADNIIDEVYFLYDKNKNIRALVDAILHSCRGKRDDVSGVENGRLCTSAACVSMFLQRVMARRLKAQVIDYTFRLTGLVTANDVYVPLLHREAMLVGDRAPPRVMYVADIIGLRPCLDTDLKLPRDEPRRRSQAARALTELFDRLADLTGHDGYLVAGVHDKNTAVELRSGGIVPIALSGDGERNPSSPPPPPISTYLENLNIMVGKKFSDDRVRYVEAMRHDAKNAAHENAVIARKLEENTAILREYVFLRSAFNPFPLWYRRRRMRGVLERIGMLPGDDKKGEAAAHVKEAHLVDALLFGTDVFHRRSHAHVATVNRKMRNLRSSASARPDLVFTDADVLDGGWLRRVQNVVVNPFAVEDPVNHRGLSAVSAAADRRRASSVIDTRHLTLSSRDALLKSPNQQTSPSACKAVVSSSTLSSSSSSSSSTSLQRKAHRIVNACGVWQVFHAVAFVVFPGAKGVPMGAFKHVVANMLMSDTRRYVEGRRQQRATGAKKGKENEDGQYRASLDAILSDHPSFGKHWRATKDVRAKKKTTSNKSTSTDLRSPDSVGPSILSAMIAEMDAPTYTTGLYDVMALAHFCDVACDVIIVHDKQYEISRLSRVGYGTYAPPPDRPPVVQVPGLPPAPAAAFNSNSGTARHAVVLVHRHPNAFDLVTNHDSLLFPYRRYEALKKGTPAPPRLPPPSSAAPPPPPKKTVSRRYYE